jgi:hypothetical protein
MRTRTVTLAALTALSLTMAACGGSSDSSSEAADTTAAITRTKNAALPATTSPKTVTTPKPTIPVRTTVPATRATTTTVNKAPTTTVSKTVTTPLPALQQNGTATTSPAILGCNGTATCKVGDKGPGGGIVFYAAATPQPWGQFMEVKPELFAQLKWDTCNLNAFDTYGKGAIGDGLKQLNAVVAACAADGTPNNAGSISAVDAHTQNGFSDWFIPSREELQALVNSKVLTFATDKDLTSYTWWSKPQDPKSRSFDVVYGVKKESIASPTAATRPPTVEIMSDGTQSYGNPNNRWGWFYIARAFGPKA